MAESANLNNQPNNPLSKKLNKILDTRIDSDKVEYCRIKFSKMYKTPRSVESLKFWLVGVVRISINNVNILSRMCGHRLHTLLPGAPG